MTTPRPSVRPSRTAARPARLLAAALAAGTLLATAACSGGDDGTAAVAEATTTAERPAAAQTTPTSATPSATPSSDLTETGARDALITEADIEDDWTQVDDPAAWRDSLLVGEVDVAEFIAGKAHASDCGRFLHSLYDETLLGRPPGASAITGFQEGDSRLFYQVAGYDKAGLDASMKRLKTLPDICDQFTLTGGDQGERTVQVVETSLPEVGDDRQGLTVTVKGTSGGEGVTLTLEVAVVQLGADAITVVNGGLDGARHTTTEAAVKQGTQRLSEVQAGRTPQPTPSGVD
ncbi:hypothetical protein [Streptomyces marokkonensis]|uniref:hypothetical protein n=1 Tax=Streptomyces marokkonensis TaxID=324855 RepID=UPI0011F0B8B0|nr:hypothetical protein [Streptomyces marokkonensis]